MEPKDKLPPASAAPVVDELKLTIEEVIRQFRASQTHKPTYCCPEDESVYDRILTRMLVEKLAAAATAAPQTKSCGFCGKLDQEVNVLIQAPVGYICEECVAVCASIIARNRTAAPVDQSDSLLAQIAAITDLGSAEEFGDALERLRSIRKLIDEHEGAR